MQDTRSRAHDDTESGGQFATDCWYSHSDTGDPVVKPEVQMRHMHEFFGNDVTGQTTSLNKLLEDDAILARDPSKQQCTHRDQKSSYWVPRITWGGQVVKPIRIGAYYQTNNGLNPANTRHFPLGFKMLAKSIAMDGPVGEKAIIHYHCGRRLTVRESLVRGAHRPPDQCDAIAQDSIYKESEAINGWRGVTSLGITVIFPECWDGNNFREPGGANMRHAVKKDGKMSCPEKFPIQLPRLVMLIDYSLPTEKGPLKVWDQDQREISYENFHADYFNAQDQKDLTRECINENRKKEMCGHKEDQ